MLLLNMHCGIMQQSNIAKFMDGSNFASYFGLQQMTFINANCVYGSSSGYGAFHVIAGAGDTPVTEEDYDMADISILANDKLRSIQQTATYAQSNGAVVTTSYRNDSASPITVKEIGLAYKNSNTAYSKAANILITRKVLDSPVTIQPGDTYVFSYNIKIA